MADPPAVSKETLTAPELPPTRETENWATAPVSLMLKEPAVNWIFPSGGGVAVVARESLVARP